MRIHTNVPNRTMIYTALRAEQDAGHIARTVGFKTLEKHRSTTHQQAFEVQLTSWDKIPGDGRRAGNSGAYGAGEEYAATYDEWGWLIAALYRLDPAAVWGSVKHPTYANAVEFHRLTGLSYYPEQLRRELIAWGEDPYPFITSRTGGHAGRMGYGRSDGDRLRPAEFTWLIANPGKRNPWGIVYQPRTLESITV